MGEDLYKIIEKAQGNRSLREFADDLGISAASLSRIKNSLQRPSPELRQRIIDLAEKPGQITINELDDAVNSIILSPDRACRDERDIISEELCAILAMELFRHGNTVFGIETSDRIYPYPEYSCIKTNQKDGSIYKWAVVNRYCGRSENNSAVLGNVYQEKMLDIAAGIYFSRFDIDKFSLTLTNKCIFERIKRLLPRFGRSPIPFSAILVDFENRRIEEECFVPLIDEGIPTSPYVNP